MNRCNRKKVTLSHSGVVALYRRMEGSIEILKDSLTRKDVWNYVKWQTGKSLDDFRARGCYVIDGRRIIPDDGFPDLACGEFAAMLMVTDTVSPGTPGQEGIIGQMLFMSDCQSGRSALFTRSCIYSQEKREWTPWEEFGDDKESIVNRLQLVERKLFPIELTLNVTPAAKEYTGLSCEFKVSWSVKIDDAAVVPTNISLKVGDDYVPVDTLDTYKEVSASDDAAVVLMVEAAGRTATKTANINFARRYYSAVVDSGWSPTSDTVKALEKTALKTAAAAMVAYSAAVQKKIVFAYPVSHGLMSAIKDAYGNSMFTLNDSGKTFNTAPTTVDVTLSGGVTLDYYVYESVVTNVTSGNITYTTKSYD